MSKFSKKLKSYLKNNPFVIYLSSLVFIVSVVWYIFEVKYDLKEKELQIMYDKRVDLLDTERSRISIRLNGKIDYLDIDDIFVDGSEVPDDYLILGDTPFAITPFYGDDKWEWKESNSREIVEEFFPDDELKPEVKELLELNKFYSYQKKEMDTLRFESGYSYLRPRIAFQFYSKNDLVNMNLKAEEILLDDETTADAETNNEKLDKPDFQMSESEMFNLFFHMFSVQNSSGISEVYGKMNETEYLFNKNVYLIYGYYNFKEDLNRSIKKFYVLRMGFLREEGVYAIDFNMPVKEDYSELKILNTLLHGFKIII
jgi:hypothetical protein